MRPSFSWLDKLEGAGGGKGRNNKVVLFRLAAPAKQETEKIMYQQRLPPQSPTPTPTQTAPSKDDIIIDAVPLMGWFGWGSPLLTGARIVLFTELCWIVLWFAFMVWFNVIAYTDASAIVLLNSVRLGHFLLMFHVGAPINLYSASTRYGDRRIELYPIFWVVAAVMTDVNSTWQNFAFLPAAGSFGLDIASALKALSAIGLALSTISVLFYVVMYLAQHSPDADGTPSLTQTRNVYVKLKTVGDYDAAQDTITINVNDVERARRQSIGGAGIRRRFVPAPARWDGAARKLDDY
jgi:hypothetical protein